MPVNPLIDQPQQLMYVTYIATTAERLWRALTQPDFTQQYWSGRRIESDWQPGSPLVFRIAGQEQIDADGTVYASEPFRLLSFGWRHPGDAAELGRVSFTLDALGDVTRLTVVHSGLEAGSLAYEGLSIGWPVILASLKSLLETGKALPEDLERERLERLGGTFREDAKTGVNP